MATSSLTALRQRKAELAAQSAQQRAALAYHCTQIETSVGRFQMAWTGWKVARGLLAAVAGLTAFRVASRGAGKWKSIFTGLLGLWTTARKVRAILPKIAPLFSSRKG